MGAQAAALLDAGGPVGDVPADPPRGGLQDGVLRLAPPAGFDLRRTALVHGGVGLAPTAWDGRRLHLRLPDPVVVEPDLRVRWRGAPPPEPVLRRVLDLDTDLEELWQACDAVASLAWVRSSAVGRVLRSPTVWQDLAGTLAGTRTSYRGTQAMLRQLVAGGPFPAPAEVAGRDLSAWGYRAPWLRALAERGDELEELADPRLGDAEVERRLRALPGFGPFAAAQMMPLLGRPRPLVLDGWLRERLGGAGDDELRERYAPMGRWAGTGAWLEAVAERLRARPEGRTVR